MASKEESELLRNENRSARNRATVKPSNQPPPSVLQVIIVEMMEGTCEKKNSVHSLCNAFRSLTGDQAHKDIHVPFGHLNAKGRTMKRENVKFRVVDSLPRCVHRISKQSH
jgi:hypothetical protein